MMRVSLDRILTIQVAVEHDTTLNSDDDETEDDGMLDLVLTI